jgi:AI-2 transport protein TqsA
MKREMVKYQQNPKAMNQVKTTDPYNGLIALAALIIVFAGIRASANIAVPMLLSVFIAVVCTYPLEKLRKYGVSKGLSISIVLISAATFCILVFLMLGTSFASFSDNLHLYQARLEELLATITPALNKVGIDVEFSQWREYFDPGAALGFVQTLLSGLRHALTNAFLIVLTVIFILFELPVIEESSEENNHSYLLIIYKIQHYFGIKAMTSLLTGVVIAIWLAIIGVDYPVLWGAMAFLLNFIPTIGSVIAAVPVVLLALIMNGTGTVLLTVAGYVVVNVSVGNVIEPRVMGQAMGLRMLVVFVSLVFWGWMLGPIGILLAVPLTMTAKIMLDSDERTRGFAQLLGPAGIPTEDLAGVVAK